MVRIVLLFCFCVGLTGCASPDRILPTRTVQIIPTLTPIIISSPTSPPSGILMGKVNIGPLTPVIRLDQPTAVPPAQVYTSRFINILLEDGKTIFLKVNFKPDGTYRVELPVGKYIVAYVRSGLERAVGLPVPVDIEKDKVTELDLDIDTGIR